MIVRQATAADYPAWATLLSRLHPACSASEFQAAIPSWAVLPEPFVAFLALADDGSPVGLIDARVRNYAEGAPNLRAAYVEDLWVEPGHRCKGVARALLGEVERWARAQGLDWLGSDILAGNDASAAWHRAAGFAEVEQLVVFGKPLQ